MKWYRKAINQGYALAQTSLGLMYGKGQGVSQDYRQAVKWFRKAAAQGEVLAQARAEPLQKTSWDARPEHLTT